MSDSVTQRFSNRAENYAKYRPLYPAEVIPFLQQELDLQEDWMIADIGSGTGISTELFLKNGNKVFAVEPNAPMREIAERNLSMYENFKSLTTTAEATEIPAGTVDLVVAAQAFHWFDLPKFKKEILRIAKPGAYLLLMWNDRRTTGNEFLSAYEQFLIKYGTDYQEVNHKNTQEKGFESLFDQGYQEKQIDNEQVLSFEGLKGRVLSSSYVPEEGSEAAAKMLLALQALFDRFQENEQVTLEYDACLYYGKVNK